VLPALAVVHIVIFDGQFGTGQAQQVGEGSGR
jgi:hypothetical protein